MTEILPKPSAKEPLILVALAAEFLGTAFLLAAIVGSGLMAADVAAAEPGIMLLANAMATGAILVITIAMFGDYSGAHFNPAVSVAMWIAGNLPRRRLPGYVAAQCAGGLFGVMSTNWMFGDPLAAIAGRVRDGTGLAAAEAFATFGLVLLILLARKRGALAVAGLVGTYIAAAIWFTASTSFANPAVTIARMLTESWVGIRPASAPPFLVAQFVGAGLAVALYRTVFDRN